MELEGYGEHGLPPVFAIFAPHNHRVAEFIGVLIDDAVEFGLNHGGGANYHIVFKIRTLGCCRYFMGKFIVCIAKSGDVIIVGDVA
jgi:hypothetical protein